MTNEEFEFELSERLRTASSFHTHLANVISGMNHELSPWLGGAINSANRLTKIINNISEETCEADKIKCIKKVERIIYALEQSTNLLSVLSSSVKRLQNYSVTTANIKDTINSWILVTLNDRFIKSLISKDNIYVDEPSLDFCAKHSPMLLSQVILNLAKNSIEHNKDILEYLQVQIYGYPDKKTIVYEDNGNGIPDGMLQKIFTPGITSKKEESHSHGLGLSACMDYCMSMGASIWAKSELGKYTQFIIKFEKSYENALYERTDSDDFDDLNEMIQIYKKKQELSKIQEEELW